MRFVYGQLQPHRRSGLMLCASCWKREAQWIPWMVSAGAEYGLTMADQSSPESSQADSICVQLLAIAEFEIA